MVYRTMSRGGTTTRRRGGFRWQIMLLFAVGAAVYYFANQKQVPYVCEAEFRSANMCRKQLRTMDTDSEMQLGLDSYKQILSDNNVLTSGPVVDAVNVIGAKIARAASDADPGFQWAFNVIESDQANAFALPGGYTAVYTGIIPVAENEDGLAIIMGHEVAHALAHHGAERMAAKYAAHCRRGSLAGGWGYGLRCAARGDGRLWRD